MHQVAVTVKVCCPFWPQAAGNESTRPKLQTTRTITPRTEVGELKSSPSNPPRLRAASQPTPSQPEDALAEF